VVRYWDKANSTSGDFTVGVLMAYCSDGYFYILDVVRGQWTSYERDRKMSRTAIKDRQMYGKVHVWHQQDPGSAGKDSAEATNRLLMGFPARFEPLTGDKETRSEPLESAFQGGLVLLLQGAWNEVFITECVAFPKGRNDDQVDAASSAYNKLLEMIGKQRESRIL
jgi:predicted phage terminase large subunit-like protein